MQKLQNQILSDEATTTKYNRKAALIAGDKRHTCSMFDTRNNENICIGESLSFRSKIESMLNMIQGPWGSYGNMIQ